MLSFWRKNLNLNYSLKLPLTIEGFFGLFFFFGMEREGLVAEAK